jgi:hypothetical protein
MADKWRIYTQLEVQLRNKQWISVYSFLNSDQDLENCRYLFDDEYGIREDIWLFTRGKDGKYKKNTTEEAIDWRVSAICKPVTHGESYPTILQNDSLPGLHSEVAELSKAVKEKDLEITRLKQEHADQIEMITHDLYKPQGEGFKLAQQRFETNAGSLEEENTT